MYVNSQAHSTKGTPSPLRALTVCKSTVSDSLSLPSRGSFHLSLTVLCAIGSWQVFSLGRWSSRIRTGFLVSRPTQVSAVQTHQFNLRGSHPLWRAFPDASAINEFSPNCTGTCTCPHADPTTPPRRNGVHLDTPPVWAPPRSLAATGGIIIIFFSSRYLDGSVP